MGFELRKWGCSVLQQYPTPVYFEGLLVGDYAADLLVDRAVIVEIKASEKLAREHEVQSLNYLKATRFEVGLLLNFGPQPQVKRMIFSNTRKAVDPSE